MCGAGAGTGDYDGAAPGHRALRIRRLRPRVIDWCKGDERLSARRGDGSWVLSVVDRGIGLDPAAQQQVFSPFGRTATSPLFDGVGLGLSVCRGIAERHGGSVWFEPRDGGGTVFHVRLPT